MVDEEELPADEGKRCVGGGRDQGGCSLGEVPSGDLADEIVALARRLSCGTFELLLLVGEFDERGTWATSGALSCAAWLAQVCDVEVSTARSQVRVARAMREHPALRRAMEAGDVSYAKARVLSPHLSASNEAELVALAESTPAGRLGAALAAWSQRNEDPEAIGARQSEQRSVSWRCEADGMVTITARLTPERAGVVCSVIDTEVARSTDAPAGASLAQQRADAFARLAGGEPAGGGTVATEVVVHVREGGNTLADGTPVSDHAVTSLLPEAFVSLLVKDMHGHPIDASPRRRAPTRRQRRVLDERQPECAHPGCNAAVFLQYDHRQRYSEGGPTVLENLQRLCGPHNRARERAA